MFVRANEIDERDLDGFDDFDEIGQDVIPNEDEYDEYEIDEDEYDDVDFDSIWNR